MAEMPLGQDASFTPEQFEARYTADLANDLGNLLSRVVKMIETHLGGVIPAPGELVELDRELERTVLEAAASMTDAVVRMKIDQGIGALLGAVRATNRYLERNQPWALAKSGDSARLRTVMYCSAETLRIVSGLLHPIMPSKMEELRRTLGLAHEKPAASDLSTWGKLNAGTALGKPVILFPKFLEAPPAASTAKDTMITIDDFKNIELKIAKVLRAERVEKSEKLVKLQISLGSEERQIVAGIAQHYGPEDLVGRTIVVVANLKPAKLMGLESQGMLLAAHDETGTLALLTSDKTIAPGSPIR
jgi:methionyl-tRNA synthetase